jgi:hypothetical protein
MESGVENGTAVEDEDGEFEFDTDCSDRRMDSAVLNLHPSFSYLPRLTAALAALNLQVRCIT